MNFGRLHAMTADEARAATAQSIAEYEQPIIARALKEIDDAITKAIKQRTYQTWAHDMSYAHCVNAEIQQRLRDRGFVVTYEHANRSSRCPTGISRYIVEWTKEQACSVK